MVFYGRIYLVIAPNRGQSSSENVQKRISKQSVEVPIVALHGFDCCPLCWHDGYLRPRTNGDRRSRIKIIVLFFFVFAVRLPRQFLRDDKDPGRGVPSAGDRGHPERVGGAVRDGQMGVPAEPAVLDGVPLLRDVLQAHAAGPEVLGTVPELVGDTAPAGQGGHDEQVPVHGPVGHGLSAAQGAHGQAVLRRRGRQGGRRPEEQEEAQAKGVRRGPRPGRGGTDAGRRGLSAGRPEPVQRDGGHRPTARPR